ncbi:hypothetical protein P168DRAFT_300669 [Aspergillus campestris IBT 28561]|uniref:Uncharacterized protein n=1 Tax=Aspergillus campestris (strain IBT 28561) TaxID=1392248 RepID=A0A2I1DDA7_ASPC2|nr:uncharacterized protein P168DRAFT_300669 [Aspergillus campestris IBT 28561]PKY07859.1 hypothetical protein P168DRAFT_300669 [Aspergillus campestris IBT 28561]
MSATLTAPASAKEWSDAVVKHRLGGQSIHSAELASASKMGFNQFLLCRVLWHKHTEHRSLSTKLQIKDSLKHAGKMLEELKSWSTYLDSFQSTKFIPEGTFAIPRKHQLEVETTKLEADPASFNTPIAARTRSKTQRSLNYEQTPSRKPRSDNAATFRTPVAETTSGDSLGVEEDDESTPPEEHEPTPFNPDTPIPPELVSVLFPPTIDEQIVNSALVTFLDAITLHFGLSSSWTLHRIPFTAVFKTAQFEARTDGYLRDRSGKPSVIIEVKPVIRVHNLVPIQIQETAQMVAWIKSDDDQAQRRHTTRLHVAQDRNQIFVMVAEYGQEYLDYLNDRPSSSPLRPRPAFLTMHQYGPWNTQRPEHMRELGPLLLAITMRADGEDTGN